MHLQPRIIRVAFSSEARARYDALGEWDQARVRRAIKNLKKRLALQGPESGVIKNRFSRFRVSRFERVLTETHYSQDVLLFCRNLDDGIEITGFWIAPNPSPDGNGDGGGASAATGSARRAFSNSFDADAATVLYVIARHMITRKIDELIDDNDSKRVVATRSVISALQYLSEELLFSAIARSYALLFGRVRSTYFYRLDVYGNKIASLLRQAIDLSAQLDIDDQINIEIMFEDVIDNYEVGREDNSELSVHKFYECFHIVSDDIIDVGVDQKRDADVDGMNSSETNSCDLSAAELATLLGVSSDRDDRPPTCH